MARVLKTDEFLQESVNEITFGKSILTPINAGTLLFFTNDSDIAQYAQPVWDMLVKSYKNIGGLRTYRDYRDFLKKKHIIAIVVDSNANILACATFRRIEGSLKMVAIGCNQDNDGKLALQQIIQYAIEKTELHFWAEVSDAIEHYFKKFNGFPMPNIMASKILSVPENEITPSKEDAVHYSRAIGKDREIFTKMIFGIKSDEIFKEVIEAIEDYYGFMAKVNNMVNESLNTKYSKQQAIYIIENLYRLHEENGINELTPNWYNALKDSIVALKMFKNKNETIYDYIGYGEYLLSDMVVLELHRIR